MTTFKSKATLAEVDELLEFIDQKLYPSKECIKEANELKNMIECETIRYNNACSKQMENSNVSKTRKFLKQNGLVAVLVTKQTRLHSCLSNHIMIECN